MLLTTYTRLVHLSFSGTEHLGFEILNIQKERLVFQYPYFQYTFATILDHCGSQAKSSVIGKRQRGTKSRRVRHEVAFNLVFF